MICCKKTIKVVMIFALLITALYSGGAAVLFWCGLPFRYLHWSTFIVVWLEFYDDRYFDYLIYVSGLGFAFPFVIAWFIFLFL
jgi:hypothetical protein